MLIPQRRSASQEHKLFSNFPPTSFEMFQLCWCRVCKSDRGWQNVLPTIVRCEQSSVTRAVTISKLVSGDRKLYIGRLNVEHIFLTITIRGIWYLVTAMSMFYLKYRVKVLYRFLSPSQSRDGFNWVEKQIILESKVWISGYAAPPSSIAITSSLLHCARRKYCLLSCWIFKINE